ncbi:MAG TPA: hypothetical protein VHD31_01875 [Candidatus Paceibacterota bacterium]|nr:hypothetical protein [Candidatus Paceibacterota bacterium]
MGLSALIASAVGEIDAAFPPAQSPCLQKLVRELRTDVHGFDPLKAYASGHVEQKWEALATCLALSEVAKQPDGCKTLLRPRIVAVH